MGFTPAEMDHMSLAEYNAVIEGWQTAHEAEEKGGNLQMPHDMTVNDLRAFMAKPGPY